MPSALDRRQFLRATATAATALPMVAASSAAEPAPQKNALTIGIATFGFTDYTDSQLAKELSAQGIRTVQLFLSQSDSRYWKYNSRSDVSDLTTPRCKRLPVSTGRPGFRFTASACTPT